MCARQRIDELVARVLDSRGETCVELDAVARLQRRMLEDGGAALGAGAERADALAQLDGSGAMAEAEADEAMHVAVTLLPLPLPNARHAHVV